MARKIYLILFFTFTVSLVHAQDPTNKEECVAMLKIQLGKQCTTLFESNNNDMEKACLENAPMEIEKQCERFFGSGNFCSVCTSECVNQFKEDGPTRIECLQTCLINPACVNTKDT
ncbi:MAG: hypothetical protein ACI85N_000314 [Gammaproteobacteria bacterium]|jgi:hypothetical protein